MVNGGNAKNQASPAAPSPLNQPIIFKEQNISNSSKFSTKCCLTLDGGGGGGGDGGSDSRRTKQQRAIATI